MQLDLLNYRRTDPPTSKEAGRAAEKYRCGDQAKIIQALLQAGRPMAAEEISDALEWHDHVRVNRRLKELEGTHLERTTERHINRSGRGAFKYRLI